MAAVASRDISSENDQLELLVSVAENTLVASDYLVAASKAEELLGKMLYIAGTSSLQVRASFVLLQAKYESNSFDDAKELLTHHYGDLWSTEPQVLFLWASLAIDAGKAEMAAETLHEYLQSITVTGEITPKHAPSDGSLSQQVTLEQYEAAAVLYAVEILAKSLSRVSAAELWIQQAPYLRHVYKQELLHELKHINNSSSAPVQALPAQSQLSHGHVQHGPPLSSEQHQQPVAVPKQSAGKLSADPDVRAHPSHTRDNEIQPVTVTRPLQPSAATQRNEGWLAQTQSWAAAIWKNEKVLIGGSELSAGQIAGAVSVAALLSCAAVAERKALKRVAIKSAQWLQTSLVDTTLAAFSFNANPMTSARPNSYR